MRGDPKRHPDGAAGMRADRKGLPAAGRDRIKPAEAKPRSPQFGKTRISISRLLLRMFSMALSVPVTELGQLPQAP